MRIAGWGLFIAAVLGITVPAVHGAEGRRAAAFAGGGPWFNTGGKALTIGGLRGKVVAVEMWTAG